MTSLEGANVTDLLDAAGVTMEDHAVVAVAGELPGPGAAGTIFVPFESALRDAGTRSLDSTSAIVELERKRAGGARFLALPAPTHAWLEERTLFGDHCRSRYDVVFESDDLGAVVDLGQPAAAITERSEGAQEDAAPADRAGAAESEESPDASDAIARSLSRLVRQPGYPANEFRLFEKHGVHVMPVHFYNPIPDLSELSDEIWSRPSELPGIDMNDDEQLRLLREVFPQFREEYEAIPTAPTEDPAAFHLNNGLFDGTDALVLYCMLRHFRPRRVIEIGSGYSTRLAAQAARVNGSTDLVSIDPYPGEVIRAGFAGLGSLIPSRVEDVSLDLFTELEASDVLFIDSSHVVRIGGDVTYLFLEVLPRLRPGVVVHVHDIFLPSEYPRDWVTGELRFWTEQYLLQAFLAFNSAFRVVFANNYANTRYGTELRETFPNAPWWGGGSFWMQRTPG